MVHAGQKVSRQTDAPGCGAMAIGEAGNVYAALAVPVSASAILTL